MSRARSMIYGIAGVTVVALAVGAVSLAPSVAQEPPRPILVEQLSPRSVFTDAVSGQFRIRLDGQRQAIVVNMPDPSRTVVARFTVQPGAQFPWHTHSDPVVVNVDQGKLVYLPASDCTARSYPARTALVDPGHGPSPPSHAGPLRPTDNR